MKHNFKFVHNYNAFVILVLIILLALTLYFKPDYLSVGKIIFLYSSIHYLIHTIQVYKRAKKEIKCLTFLEESECQVIYFSNMATSQKVKNEDLVFSTNSNEIIFFRKKSNEFVGKINNKGVIPPEKLEDFILLLEQKVDRLIL
jgi:hypothetical protein